eukprot:TRINITY_DN26269_c1_g1_i1.p1 TRINITY_DN26269_c1_g1~~TRINITY_DN26269_c1_g1_i1.p1  ORF type:complete len:910 (-),score=177.36 TRINITY_DN26269_c1_g1_i1:258-2987(-)
MAADIVAPLLATSKNEAPAAQRAVAGSPERAARVDDQCEPDAFDADGSWWSRRSRSWYSAYQRALKHDLNPRYAQNAEAALRCGITLTVMAVPLMVDPESLPTCLARMVENGIYTQNATLYLIFSVWSTFGETMDLLKQGVLGTAIAIGNQWFMVALFPDGVAGSTAPTVASWVIILNGIAFTWTCTWLNFDTTTVMWAIQTYVFYWMEFLDPQKTPHTPAQAASATLGALFGGLGCLVAMLLPYPLFTIWRAQDAALRLQEALRETWRELDESCGDRGSILRQGRFAADVAGLGVRLGALEQYLRVAWWESWCSRRWRQSRRMLWRYCQVMHEASERLSAARSLFERHQRRQAARDDYAGALEAMRGTRAKALHLLELSTRVAVAGELSATSAAALAACASEARTALAASTAAFSSARATAQPEAPAPEFAEEHVYGHEVSALCRLALEFTADLLADFEGEQPLPYVKETSTLRDIFDPQVLFGHKQLSFAARHTTKVLMAFLFGYYGFRHVDRSYDAGTANVVAVMVNRASLGSELSKNMARVQGAVLGTILGQIGQSAFEGCNWLDMGGKLMSLFLASVTSFMAYFHATLYTQSYIGFIGIFFFSKVMVQRCGSASESNPEMFYFNVVDIVTALVIISAIDSAIDLWQDRRPSRRATRQLRQAWASGICELQQLFDPDCGSPTVGRERSSIIRAKTSVQKLRGEGPLHRALRCLVGPPVAAASPAYHGSDFMSSLEAAVLLGAEAAQEPRGWRLPWRETLFTSAVERSRAISLSISSMNYVATNGSEEKSPFFYSLVQAPSVQRLQQHLCSRMEYINTHLLAFFDHDAASTALFLYDSEAWNDGLEEWAALYEAALEDVSHIKPVPTVRCNSLEDNPYAQAAFLLVLADAIMSELQEVQLSILSAA